MAQSVRLAVVVLEDAYRPATFCVPALTHPTTEMLRLIAERGAATTSSLALIPGIDPSTASRDLAGLEHSGLITRKKGSEDGRQTDIRLTPRGRRAAEAVTKDATVAFAALIDRVPRGDRQRVTDALETLALLVDGAG